MKYVIKRGKARRVEPYSREKLHQSILGTCLSVRTPVGDAESIAQDVCESVETWLGDKTEITSADLRHHAAQALEMFNPEAAYYYKNQKRII